MQKLQYCVFKNSSVEKDLCRDSEVSANENFWSAAVLWLSDIVGVSSEDQSNLGPRRETFECNTQKCGMFLSYELDSILEPYVLVVKSL